MKHNIINLGQFRIFPRIIDILLELLPYLLIKKLHKGTVPLCNSSTPLSFRTSF